MNQRERDIYIAAIVDTEGALVLGHRKEFYGVTYIPYLTVCMGSPEIVYYLKELIGTGFVNYRIKENKGSWEYRCCAETLRWLLPEILPFLKIKQAEANLLLKVLATNKATKRMRIWARWNKIKWLNYIKETQHYLNELYQRYKQIRITRYPIKA